MKTFSSAAVFGKFWPLHLGHLQLIETARDVAEDVLVVVDDGEEDVSAAVRVGWVRSEFPDIEVTTAPDLCGHDSADCTLACSERYATWLTQHHGSVAVVVAGDSYGQLLARCLGAESIQFTRNRTAGRVIRANMVEHWSELSSSARAFYCRRVVIVGAESTGKTTLATDLADALQTVWVPEYGRTFTVEHGIDHEWTSADFEVIARQQNADEDDGGRRSGPVLICDTDAMATGIWHERYMRSRSARVETIARRRRADLYLLTNDDIPFVQDGLRDGEHIRGWMTERFREALTSGDVAWQEIAGDRFQRLERAKEAIRDQFDGNWLDGRPS